MSFWTFTGDVLLLPVLKGTLVTLQLILLSVLPQFLIGNLIAAGRVYGSRPLSLACRLYVGFFRGTPLLIQLFILYYGLPSLGIYLQPMAAAVIGFSLCGGAYMSEYIRGAIQSIRQGQMQAALSLGMSRIKAILYITFPQTLRRALPGCSNEVVYLIKYSSLAFMVTCLELTGQGKIVASRYFRYTQVFIVVGAVYLILVTIATRLLALLEKKLEIPGLEVSRR